MTKTFTPHEQIIRSMYGETSAIENQQLLEQVSNNTELAEIAFEWLAISELMNAIEDEPSQSCIDSILAYARSEKQPSIPL